MQGVVERVRRKGRRTALMIDGEWYSTFEPVEVNEGDRVEFNFKTVRKNGREYKNLKTIEVLFAKVRGGGGLHPFPSEALLSTLEKIKLVNRPGDGRAGGSDGVPI